MFWETTLKEKVEKVKLRRAFKNRRVRLEEIIVVASVLQYRSQPNFYQQFQSAEVDWTDVEEQLLDWGGLIKKGKQLILDVSINYLADDTGPDPKRKGDKRGTNSTTSKMLAEIETLKLMLKLQLGNQQRGGMCIRKCAVLGPAKTKIEEGRLDLGSHDDVPGEIREELYAKEQKQRERALKPSASAPAEPGHSIHINVMPSQSPQPSVLATPADNTPSKANSKPVDSITFPDTPLEVALDEYSSWQKSRVISQKYQDGIDKARDVALDNGLDLKQIHGDQDPDFFIKHGVKIGVARRFVNEIPRWAEERGLDG
ncbi:hypothetical protein FE257_004099 [Aspergillus nanangensis]|uniref:Uncharacterized protein n=1 Tax=Aspergillus nanangensis TaxID=2582783 RepID=A0AAD4GN83_ASPNN|nr:hypothetical protein FE257_004099 [Aspergillus nanangensis]